MELKQDAPERTVTDICVGDYVRVGNLWKKVSSNTAAGDPEPPRDWTIATSDGRTYSTYAIKQFAKAKDMVR